MRHSILKQHGGSTLWHSACCWGHAAVLDMLPLTQPFDFEHRAKRRIAQEKQLKIGIVGFGTFGQFLALRFLAKGHRVLATSRSSYHNEAKRLGVEFYQDADDFCEEHPDVSI